MSAEDYFWDLAEELMAHPGVEEGTMMGHRCLRSGGGFAAMTSSGGDELIVKLSAGRVEELIADGVGEPFAPAGKVFREWTQVPSANRDAWEGLMREAVSG